MYFISFCHHNGEHFHQLGWNLFIFVQLIAHAVLDVVVLAWGKRQSRADDEVEFLLREAVVLGKDFVDLYSNYSLHPLFFPCQLGRRLQYGSRPFAE